jgi:16S rRNA (guanine(966)-N(2))-methyltransferase RsmD
MRVIAGKARRLQLKTIEGQNTRPTTDRIKETLFNMIQYHLEQSSFLDLYSGSGAIGIEALSRGAGAVYFVENNRAAVQCIKDNLKSTKLEEDAVVLPITVEVAIRELDNKKKCFDFIFMDPPYNNLYEKAVLESLVGTSLIDEDTMIIVEASLDTDFSYAEELGYEIIKEKAYKTNKHIFLRKSGE